MLEATYVKTIVGWTGDAKLYKLSPKLEGNKYVIVSTTHVMLSGPETYIFGATEDGEVTDWGELPGSYKGGLDHNKALEDAGYSTITYPLK